MQWTWRLAHEPRRIDPLAPLSFADWNLKVYAVCGLARPIPAPMLAAATQVATANLPMPAKTAERYGVGFVICHEARAFNTVTLDWWEHTNELRHLVFRAPPGQWSFSNITGAGQAACVWELHIIAFERGAWVDSVLIGSKMDFARYNSVALSGMY